MWRHLQVKYIRDHFMMLFPSGVISTIYGEEMSENCEIHPSPTSNLNG